MLFGQPQRVGPAGNRRRRGKTIDDVVLRDAVRLMVEVEAGNKAEALILWRVDAQFVAGLGIAIDAVDMLARVDVVAVVVGDVFAVAGQRVVPERIVAVVRVGPVAAVEMGERIDEIEVADLALHGQRTLHPAVFLPFRVAVTDLEVADLGVERVAAAVVLALAHDRRRDRPVVVEIEFERRARTAQPGFVIGIVHAAGVVRSDARGRIGAGAEHVVDIAAVVLVPADHAQRGLLR